MARGDMAYLERHGDKLRVQVRVPANAYQIIGKRFLKVPLGHGSVERARAEKHAIVARLKEEIRAAVQKAEREASTLATMDPLDREALEWREVIEAERQEDAAAAEAAANRPHSREDRGEVTFAEREEAENRHESFVTDRAEAIERTHGLRRAQEFHDKATGKVTPLDWPLEEWLAGSTYDAKRKGLNRRAIRRLAEWCKGARVAGALQAITPMVAARFEDQVFPAHSTPAQTFASYKTALRAYWRWLIERGMVAGPNPWDGRRRQAVKAHRVAADVTKRPFTEDEARALLDGPASQRLHDAMRIAALSGMRLGEIAGLRIRQCVGGVFEVRIGKTKAGRRTLPIHTQLSPIITRLTAGKSGDDYLIAGLNDPPEGSERTRDGPLVKEFVRYRRKVGVDETATGNRQSNIDFHSWRRWFVDARVRALAAGVGGFTEGTISDVVGHDREGLGMTRGVYAGTAPEAEKRRCVEAVGLPEGVALEVRARTVQRVVHRGA